jgi:hypothetical protein
MSAFLPPVKPGDVITSQLWNQVVDTVNALLLRVTDLESASIVQGGKLTIIDFNPKPAPMGSDLTVFGANFGLAGESIITVDGKQVILSKIKQATNSLLVFEVPPVQSVPAGPTGKPVTMTISHSQNGFAATTITVIQAIATVPQGTLTLNLSQPPAAATIDPGNSYVFGFAVTTISNMTETYSLTALLPEQPAWNAVIVNQSGDVIPPEVEIPKGDPPDGASATVRVRVSIPPGTAAGTTGNLRLRAAARRNSSFFGESSPTPIVVSQPPPTQDESTVTFDPTSTGGSVGPGGVRVPVSVPVLINFRAVVPHPGNYTVENPQVTSNQGNLWSAQLGTAASQTATLAGETLDLPIEVTSQAGAQPTQVRLRIHLTSDPTIDGAGQVNIHT